MSHPKAVLFAVVAVSASVVGYMAWGAHQRSAAFKQRLAETERRLAVCNDIYHTIERYHENPDFLTRHEAMVAKDRIYGSDLGEKRADVLRAYWRDVETCRTGMAASRRLIPEETAACKKMASDGMAALDACVDLDLDYDPNWSRK